ncbi:MAG: hypothetical protein HC880_19905, partial [Bacteroidia bacterium]|nr:hypothetical protein [Bacteroidia bacterium]
MSIPEIKARLSILEVLAHYGLHPDKNGMLRCPFHDDRTPSMQVYPKKGTVYCFSTNCLCGGKVIDVIDFMMHYEKLSKHQAILKAQALAGLAPETKPKPQAQKTMTNPSPPEMPEDLSEVFVAMQQSLVRSKTALAYLAERGLKEDPRLEVGYNHYKSGFKKLQNCLVFPLKDAQGKIISLYGRSLSGSEGQRHFYLRGRRGLYPGYPPPETSRIVLVESVLDAATLQLYTPEYPVLALFGNKVLDEHLEALSGLEKLEEVIFFLDGDEAGRSASEKYAPQLSALLPGVAITEADCPGGEDPNSLLQSHQPEVLVHLLENRHPFQNNSPTLEETAPKEPPTPPKAAGEGRLDTTREECLYFEMPPLEIWVLGGLSVGPMDKLPLTLKIKRSGSQSPLHQLRHRLDLYHDEETQRLMRKTAERL